MNEERTPRARWRPLTPSPKSRKRAAARADFNGYLVTGRQMLLAMAPASAVADNGTVNKFLQQHAHEMCSLGGNDYEPDYFTDDWIPLWSDVAILPEDTQKKTKKKNNKPWHNNKYTRLKFEKIDTIIWKKHLTAKIRGMVGVGVVNELQIQHVEKYSGGLFY